MGKCQEVAVSILQILMALLGEAAVFSEKKLCIWFKFIHCCPKIHSWGSKSHVGEVLCYIHQLTYLQVYLKVLCPKEASLLLSKINDLACLALLGSLKHLEHINKINHSLSSSVQLPSIPMAKDTSILCLCLYISCFSPCIPCSLQPLSL